MSSIQRDNIPHTPMDIDKPIMAEAFEKHRLVTSRPRTRSEPRGHAAPIALQHSSQNSETPYASIGLKRKHTRTHSSSTTIFDTKRRRTDAEESQRHPSTRVQPDDERIWCATACGNVDTLKALFEALPKNQRANAANLVHRKHLVPPLLSTLCPRTIRTLLEYGADPKLSGSAKVTALDIALLQENVPMMAEILKTEKGRECLTIRNTRWPVILGLRKTEKGEDESVDEQIEREHGFLEKPLMIALHQRNVEAAELILKTAKEHPSLNIFVSRPWREETSKIIRQGDIALLKLFLDYGLDPNQKSMFGNPLLLTAFWDLGGTGESLDANWVRLLLERGANVNAVGRLDITALHRCVMLDKIDIAKLLLDNGASVSMMAQSTGLRPIHHVRSPNMLKLLLSYGANMEEEDREGRNIAHRVVDSPTMIQFLIEKMPEYHHLLSKPDHLGRAPLYFAMTVRRPSTPAISLLLQYTDLSLPMETTWYPRAAFRGKKEKESYLHLAVRSDNFEIFETVLEEYKKRHFNINLRNLALESPIILAVLENKLNYFTLLEENDANMLLPFPNPIFSPNNPVVSSLPLTILAADSSYDDIVDEILVRGRDKLWGDVSDSQGNGPLHYAVHTLDDDRVYRVLAEGRFDPNAINGMGDTPMHFVIKSLRGVCELQLVRPILETMVLGGAGASLQKQDRDGNIPMELLRKKYRSLKKEPCPQSCRGCGGEERSFTNSSIFL
ncbi:hypothetical protein H072_11227 [Dactylellina haptotyla CBS 200.50]|uniref:Uncharacterized protein n=1 Tax=Dactylellina haptotyla (strain CBS 200.50) TaxID=1284197 RepID=S7ZXC1_DACHA|nr:hypothetical protein H072_11227 [Dactylellina haptotyla CBS 200.50]